MTGQVLRGRVLTFFERPAALEDEASYGYWANGAIAIRDGRIVWRGEHEELPEAFREWTVKDHRPHLIVPGFIDTHTHFVQMGVIGAYGTQLLDWLRNYTFPEESRFSDPVYARHVAGQFLDELVGNGVTTAAVYGSSHKVSADSFFAEADARGMCMIAGKTLMDRNAPDNVCDTPQSGYDDSRALIAKWHGKGRLHYAVTPRFAITSSRDQLEVTGALFKAHPDCYLQSHLSENDAEVAFTGELFPEAEDYLAVYQRYGLIGGRALFGHCLHLSPREIAVMAESRSVAVFCPTSNLFLGSGLFDYAGLGNAGVRIALASDIGGGTSYSMLATAAEAYKVCQLRGLSLNPLETFYLLTLGNARALSLESRIGTLEPETDADIAVLDSRATPAMAARMDSAHTLIDELFALQTLGDDRSVAATYVAGRCLKPAALLSALPA